MIDLGNGIYQIDAHYFKAGIAALYIVKQGNQCVIIETGTNASLPQILTALKTLALSTDDVRYVIPTHIHLDHAGGAGQLMQKCANAELIIHPFGAKHMVDPSRLIAGTIAVYGEKKFHQLYGDILPIDAGRIIEAPDGFSVALNGRHLLFIDTPGHANHHFCIYDEQSKGVFTGDTLGVSYPQLTQNTTPFIFASTTPVQFNPDKLTLSIDTLWALKPTRFFPYSFWRSAGNTGAG